MIQRIKIVQHFDPGAVVNLVNDLLRDGWMILSEHVIAIDDGGPYFVVFLTRDENP